jgi:hypothetical protein
MKKHSVFLGFLTATLFAAPVFAQGDAPAATPAPAAAPEAQARSPRERMLEKFDANHDGQLDKTERQAARAEWKKHHHGRHGIHHARAKLHHKLLKRFDANHDGKLSKEERAEIRKAAQQRHQRASERRHEMLERFDRDHDGKLNEAERADAKKAWQDFLQQHPVVTPEKAG